MPNRPTIDDVKDRRSEIARRRGLIAESQAGLKAEDSRLAAEDQELEIAERALARLAGLSAPQPEPAIQTTLLGDDELGAWLTIEGWKAPGRSFPSKGTIEEMIAYLLEGSVDPWANSNQIRAALSNASQRPVPMSTVSPTLTIMKNKGTIVRDNMKVALASRVQMEKAAAE